MGTDDGRFSRREQAGFCQSALALEACMWWCMDAGWLLVDLGSGQLLPTWSTYAEQVNMTGT
jgi:hypothetical protein